jgi:hypothetical protein
MLLYILLYAPMLYYTFMAESRVIRYYTETAAALSDHEYVSRLVLPKHYYLRSRLIKSTIQCC